MLHRFKLLPLAGAACLAAGTALAFWSSDPLQNLAVADPPLTQTIPLVASAPDGGTYVAWFDDSSGSFRVYLQRLDAAGVERWPHNGLLISAHPQNTALFGWDMIADSSGNAVLVFSDTRDGGDLDIHAYRIGPGGEFLWGPDGVTLSTNADFEPAPRVAETTDGDFVCVWQRDPAAGDGDIRMQRLSPSGTPRLAPGGMPVVVSAGEDPGFVLVIPSAGGDVILAWLRNIRTFASPRHLRAQRFSATGLPVWPAPVTVHDQFPLPIGYFPEMRSDGSGGAVLAWHRSDGTFISAFAQRLDAAGNELFPHQGIEVTTTAGMHHISPAPAYDPSTGSTYVFWNERNGAQSQWGLLGQRVTAAGARAWGAGGLALLPVNATFKSTPRAVGHAGDAIVVLVDQPASTDRLIALRLNASGGLVWGGSPAVISSASSTKARYPVSIDPFGVTKVAWEDNRNGSIDVYAQNVLPNGSLGVSPVPGKIGGSLRIGRSSITPGNLVLTWDASCSPGAANYAIYEGSLGDFTSHISSDCSDGGGDRTEELTPASGDRYYLVVVQGVAAEGSYGTDSNNAERPQAAPGSRCLVAQELASCGP